MGDNRATIKVSFEIYGEKFEQEFWINYWPDEMSGVDERIANWFRDSYLLAKAREQVRFLEG